VEVTTAGDTRPVPGPVVLTRYSRAQYLWRPAGARGRALRSLPREILRLLQLPLELPPASLSVVRLGQGPEEPPSAPRL
jgi:hypothetical protein